MAKYLLNPPPKIPPWTERNELNLLNAVLEIANEPIESYDPRINLFDRINKNMVKSLTDREILDKIKELRNRFEKRWWNREFRNKAVKTTKAFAISEKIWGKGMEIKIERIRKKKWLKEETAKSWEVNPQEASRPNSTNKRTSAEPKYKCQPAGKKQKVKGSCFISGNVGHVARECSKMKIAKQSTKQQETKDISKGSVELQFKTENKHKELSAGSVLSCSQPGFVGLSSEQTKQRDEVHDCSQPVTQDYSSSQPVAQDYIGSQCGTHQSSSERGVKFNYLQPGDNQHTSEQTKQGDEMVDGSQPVAQDYVRSESVAHQPSSEQRMKLNNPRRGDNQHTSEQRTKVPSNFKSGTYQRTPNQKKPFNRFRPSSYRRTSHQWKRESFTRPPKWGGRGPPHPIATPLSFPQHPVPYQYPAPPIYRQSPPPY